MLPTFSQRFSFRFLVFTQVLLLLLYIIVVPPSADGAPSLTRRSPQEWDEDWFEDDEWWDEDEYSDDEEFDDSDWEDGWEDEWEEEEWEDSTTSNLGFNNNDGTGGIQEAGSSGSSPPSTVHTWDMDDMSFTGGTMGNVIAAPGDVWSGVGEQAITNSSTTTSPTTNALPDSNTYPFTGSEGSCYALKHVSDGQLMSRCTSCVPNITVSVVSMGTVPRMTELWCPYRLNATTFVLKSKDTNQTLSVQSNNYNTGTKARALKMDAGTTVGLNNTWTWTMANATVMLHLASTPNWFLGKCSKCQWNATATPDALVDASEVLDMKEMTFTVVAESS